VSVVVRSSGIPKPCNSNDMGLVRRLRRAHLDCPRAALCEGLVWLACVIALGSTSCTSKIPAGSAGDEGPAAAVLSLDLALSVSGPRSEVPRRVVLVSIEGLTPDSYESSRGGRLLEPEASLAPTLTRMARGGVYADEVVPAFPSLVYPAHASLVTGRPANRHGITGDWLIGETGVRPVRPWEVSRLAGDSLWLAASELDRPVAALDWPTTVGAPVEYLVPDLVPILGEDSWLGFLEGSATPSLLSRLREGKPDDAGPGWPSPEQRDAQLTELACFLIGAEPPPILWLLRLSHLGVTRSEFGPDSIQAEEALRQSDARLRRLASCFHEAGLLATTAFVIVGDRSILPIHTRIRPNRVLVEAGLITPPAHGAGQSVTSWTALARSNGATAFVYARDEPSAILARKALDRAAEAMGTFRVVPAKELAALGGDPQAWFGLEAEPGYSFSDSATGQTLEASSSLGAAGAMPSRPDAGVGFVAWGGGVRRGIRIPWMEQLDVAPTVAALLSLPLRESDGRVLVGALNPPVLEAH